MEHCTKEGLPIFQRKKSGGRTHSSYGRVVKTWQIERAFAAVVSILYLFIIHLSKMCSMLNQ